MTQPSFVPISEVDQVRPALRLRDPGSWSPSRPAEIKTPRRLSGRSLGTPGPDQGYALALMSHIRPMLVLNEGESMADVEVGLAAIASRRSGHFGRAPSIHDLHFGVALFNFAGPAPSATVAIRKAAFGGLSHSYVATRALCDRIPDTTLALNAEQVAEAIAAGTALIDA